MLRNRKFNRIPPLVFSQQRCCRTRCRRHLGGLEPDAGKSQLATPGGGNEDNHGLASKRQMRATFHVALRRHNEIRSAFNVAER